MRLCKLLMPFLFIIINQNCEGITITKANYVIETASLPNLKSAVSYSLNFTAKKDFKIESIILIAGADSLNIEGISISNKKTKKGYFNNDFTKIIKSGDYSAGFRIEGTDTFEKENKIRLRFSVNEKLKDDILIDVVKGEPVLTR